MTPSRKALIEQVLHERTRRITLVMEDIDKPHNAGAVLRTADCFGIQDLHLIETTTAYKHSQGVTRGSTKWLNLYRHRDPKVNNTEACFRFLKERGYRIYVTSPAAEEEGTQHLDLQHNTAILFGTEWFGASDYAKEHADGFVKLPMYGFTESFNISVAAALTMQQLVMRLRQEYTDWGLSEEEIRDLRLEWYRNSVKNPEIVEKAYWSQQQESEAGDA